MVMFHNYCPHLMNYKLKAIISPRISVTLGICTKRVLLLFQTLKAHQEWRPWELGKIMDFRHNLYLLFTRSSEEKIIYHIASISKLITNFLITHIK